MKKHEKLLEDVIRVLGRQHVEFPTDTPKQRRSRVIATIGRILKDNHDLQIVRDDHVERSYRYQDKIELQRQVIDQLRNTAAEQPKEPCSMHGCDGKVPGYPWMTSDGKHKFCSYACMDRFMSLPTDER